MERKTVDFHAHAFHDTIAIKAAEQLRDYYGIELAEDGLFIHLKQSMIKNKIDKNPNIKFFFICSYFIINIRVF